MIQKTFTLAALVALALSTQAQTTSGIAITGAGVEFSNSSSWILGYSFAVSAPITVTALGIYDSGSDGLAQSHDIGLWSASQALLAQASIAAGGGTLVDGFRYTTVSPVVLQPGNYVVGATMGSELYWYDGPISTAPEITFIQDQYVSSGGLAFPSNGGTVSAGYFGANFRYAVPEPSTWVMSGVFGVAAAVTVGMRRRQTVKA